MVMLFLLLLLSQKIQLIGFLAIFFAIFSAVASPVRGWLHMRLSPRAGDVTIFKKSHHHRKQKIARVPAASIWLQPKLSLAHLSLSYDRSSLMVDPQARVVHGKQTI